MFNEQEAINEYGFYAHYVYETEGNREFNGLANLHTHGLKESFNHMDLQLVIPINMQTASGLFHTVAKNIKKGKTYQAGKLYDDVIRNYFVKFENFTDKGRPVLRMILPDEKGFFPGDRECSGIYRRQTEVLRYEE